MLHKKICLLRFYSIRYRSELYALINREVVLKIPFKNYWTSLGFLKRLLTSNGKNPKYSYVLKPTDHEELNHKIYASTNGSSPFDKTKHAFIIIHGINTLGPRDPRTIKLANSLSAIGYAAFVPDIYPLRKHLMDVKESSDILYNCCDFLVKKGTTSISFIGACFSGSTTLLTASLPNLKERIKGIFLVGTYFNSKRALTRTIKDKESSTFGFLVTLKNIFTNQGNNNKDFLRVLNQAINDSNLDRNFLKTKKLIATLKPDEQELINKLINRSYDPEELLTTLKDGLEKTSIKCDYRIMLSKINSPFFILHGKNDKVISEKESIELNKFLKSEKKKSKLLITPLLIHTTFNIKANILTPFRILKLAHLLSLYLKEVPHD